MPDHRIASPKPAQTLQCLRCWALQNPAPGALVHKLHCSKCGASANHLSYVEARRVTPQPDPTHG